MANRGKTFDFILFSAALAAQSVSLVNPSSFMGWQARLTTPVVAPGSAAITVEPGLIISDGELSAPALGAIGEQTLRPRRHIESAPSALRGS